MTLQSLGLLRYTRNDYHLSLRGVFDDVISRLLNQRLLHHKGVRNDYVLSSRGVYDVVISRQIASPTRGFAMTTKSSLRGVYDVAVSRLLRFARNDRKKQRGILHEDFSNRYSRFYRLPFSK